MIRELILSKQRISEQGVMVRAEICSKIIKRTARLVDTRLSVSILKEDSCENRSGYCDFKTVLTPFWNPFAEAKVQPPTNSWI